MICLRGAAATLLFLPVVASEAMIDGTPVVSIWEACTVVGQGGLAPAPSFVASPSGFEGSGKLLITNPVTKEQRDARLSWTIGTVIDLRDELEGVASIPAGTDFIVRTHIVSGDRQATGWTAVDLTDSGRLQWIPLGVRDSERRFFPSEDQASFGASLFGSVGLTNVLTNVVDIPSSDSRSEGD